MGVVYKARDTELGRIVAIKVLPAGRNEDSERRKRFIQEARAASSLNHPNIVTIHEFLHENGTDFIVMEFVAGRTLDLVIARRALRLPDALKYSLQMADALSKAHSAGIVHRDIKPGNIMVTEDGVVKILDFGLAKLTAPEHLSSETESTETQAHSVPETEEGAIVGTVAYMSPEQAEGRRVDARSDIFSFGAVLFEMLTGQRPFQGPSRMATLASIIREEPKRLADLAPSMPADLEKLVARCLRKDPERRTQHMSDVKLALQDLKEESESGQLPPGLRPNRQHSRTPVLWAIAAVLTVSIAGAFWFNHKPERGALPRVVNLRQLTADEGLTTTPAMSADGKLVAYASDRGIGTNLDIWIHPMTEGAQPHRLTTNEADDMYPSFSPDGGSVAFRSNREGGGVYIIPVHGGEERLLARFGTEPRFSADGKSVIYRAGEFSSNNFLSETRVYVVSATGGSSRLLAPNLVLT